MISYEWELEKERVMVYKRQRGRLSQREEHSERDEGESEGVAVQLPRDL